MSDAQAWQSARDALLEGAAVCLMEDARFCLDTPEDLDPHIQKLVDRQYKGTMPTSLATAISLGRQARASYRGWWQRDADAQRRVLERVEGRLATAQRIAHRGGSGGRPGTGPRARSPRAPRARP